jgi:hypothetical protein
MLDKEDPIQPLVAMLKQHPVVVAVVVEHIVINLQELLN